jgi:hypothetical protein
MTGTPIAAIAGAEGAVIEALLAEMAAHWRACGLNVCGALAESDRVADRTCSAGFLCNIETGARYAMYLDESPAHTSCHLDETGIVEACASVLDRIAASDVVVLSKFGKVEAVGSGLFEAFETAIALGKPILTSVAPKHRYAWDRFAPDAVILSPERAALESWLGTVRPQIAPTAVAGISLPR